MSLLKVHECFCKHPTVGPFSGKNHCRIISPGGHCSPPQREFRVHVGGRGPAPLLQCICIPLLTEAPSVIGCFAEFTFLPLGISSFWLSWHKSCDTLVISPGHQSVSLSLSLSVFLGSYKPPGVLCVLCLDTVPTPGTPRTQWHCSVWPIECDPGSGGNSWWILQYQPTWHQGWALALALNYSVTVPNPCRDSFENSLGVAGLFPPCQVCRCVVMLRRFLVFKAHFSFELWKVWAKRRDPCQVDVQ